jgi:hypothetical protein
VDGAMSGRWTEVDSALIGIIVVIGLASAIIGLVVGSSKRARALIIGIIGAFSSSHEVAFAASASLARSHHRMKSRSQHRIMKSREGLLAGRAALNERSSGKCACARRDEPQWRTSNRIGA